MTRKCPNCGKSNSDDAFACTHCQMVLPPARKRAITRPEAAVTIAPESARRAIAEGLQIRTTSPAPQVTENDVTVETNRSLESTVEWTDGIPMEASRLTIGFRDNNDIVVSLPQVSGEHAVIAYVDGRYVLSDRSSTNGTSLNGETIQLTHLEIGDTIGLGSYQMVFTEEIANRVNGSSAASGSMETKAIDISGMTFVSFVVGRDSDCDIVLDAAQISRRHAKITSTGDGWLVEDLRSANGTACNDRTNLITKAVVTEKDVLFFGSYRFPVSRIREFLDMEEDVPGGVLELPAEKTEITIGRGPNNDLVIDAPQISRHHARLLRTDEGIFLEDRASANGTFVNGERIQRVLLDQDDTISFGSYAVRLDLTRGQLQKSYRGDILLQAEDLRVTIQDGKREKELLKGLSFTVYPTEFVGLMGPSGSGKTTLLMSLIGYLRPTSGKSLLNGDDLSSYYDRYRGAIGYVPQEDIIHRELTVYEALYYTAKLRLPPDTTDQEIDERIMKILRELEIESTCDVRIGTPERKGISGGQRKRVNLALELLTEPSLLCLDEPTSGLASEDALNVIALLRKLADGGRTILLTIHQPSQRAYRQFDNVLYVASGNQVYYGPAFPDSILYFFPDVAPNTPEADTLLADPGSCMRPIMNAARAGTPMETLAARYRESHYHEEFVEERRKNRTAVRLTGSGERQRPRFSIRQWLTLCARYRDIRLKDRVGLFILLIQAPVIGILLDLVFMTDTGGVIGRLQYMPFALFLLSISAIWFGCSAAAREIVSEQAIYKRERMVNLSIGAYILSKFTVLGGFCLVQCCLLVAFTFVALDFMGNPIYHLLILWTASLAGIGMGLALSAWTRTSEAAASTVPILLIPQIILGGAIMPIEKMNDLMILASHTMISRWAFEGMLQTEHLADAYELSIDDLPKPLGPGLPAPPPPPNPLDHFFGMYEKWLAVDLAVQSAFIVLLLAFVYLLMRFRER